MFSILMFVLSLYGVRCCRSRLGPNEVDVKDLQSLPNASKKDSAAPAIQKYADPPKGKNKVRKHKTKRMLSAVSCLLGKTAGCVGQPRIFYPVSCMLPVHVRRDGVPLPSARQCKLLAK